MPRQVLAAIVCLGALGVVWSIAGRLTGPPAAAIEIAEPSPSASSPAVVVVDVAGAVARPSVVRLPSGARVLDALAAAGGTTPDADLLSLNRAAVLRDGERLYVPRAGEVPSARAAAAGETRVDVNRATAGELETLPGVGPGIAARIIRSREQRPFARVEELQTFAELRDLVVIR